LSSHQAFFAKLDFIIIDGTTSVTGFNIRSGAGNVTTTTNNAHGGDVYGNQGSLSYLWEYVSGETAAVQNPTNIDTSFSRTRFVTIAQSLTFNGVYRLKVTDNVTGNIIYGPNCIVSTTHEESS
jgi:hypothetical protein